MLVCPESCWTAPLQPCIPWIVCFITTICFITIICFIIICFISSSSFSLGSGGVGSWQSRCQPGHESWERGTDPLQCQKIPNNEVNRSQGATVELKQLHPFSRWSSCWGCHSPRCLHSGQNLLGKFFLFQDSHWSCQESIPVWQKCHRIPLASRSSSPLELSQAQAQQIF